LINTQNTQTTVCNSGYYSM